MEVCKLPYYGNNIYAHAIINTQDAVPPEAVVVQFIHQSVKDYFLEGGLQILDSDSSDVIGRGHFSLSRSCIRYLGIEEIRYRELTASDESYRSAPSAFPFFDYSVKFWPLHLQEVEQRKIPHEDLGCFGSP